MSAAPAHSRALLTGLVLAAALLLPGSAQAYSLSESAPTPDWRGGFSLAPRPAHSNFPASFGSTSPSGRDQAPILFYTLAGDPALAAPDSGSADAEPPEDPGFAGRPHPGLGQYCRDTAILTVAVFAWKRALNATAARRMFVDHYEAEYFHTPPFINDGNNWVTNWISHPLVGMWYYQYFRSFGYSRLASGFGSFFISAVHEYLIETSFEPPSGIDILLTPGIGVPLGILTDEVSVEWVRSDSKIQRFGGYILNPFLAMPWSRWRRDVSYDPRSDRFEFTLSFDF